MWQIIYTGEKKEILPEKLKVLADCTASPNAFNQGHMIDWLMYFKSSPSTLTGNFATFWDFDFPFLFLLDCKWP